MSEKKSVYVPAYEEFSAKVLTYEALNDEKFTRYLPDSEDYKKPFNREYIQTVRTLTLNLELAFIDALHYR
jgi:hypothetical protein